MMVEALEQFQAAYSVSLDKITCIPLEGEGTIDRRVEKYVRSLANFVTTKFFHQGCTTL
jgi:hypothetical protein